MGLLQLVNGQLQQVPLYDAGIDAFGRGRVSTPVTIFDSKQVSDNQPLFWDDAQVSGSGTTTTYQTNKASTRISVSASTTGKRIRQTKRRFNYQPGKSQLIFMTANFGSSTSGIIKRAGYFDDKNGLFFEQNSSGFHIGLRTFTSGSASDSIFIQSSWNYDKLDGTGISGYTLDFTKSQILFIDFEWLAVGQIRFGFVLEGIARVCHIISNLNNLTSSNLVYMSTPNLPLRYEIENTGVGVESDLYHICSTVISEGGKDDIGFPFGVSRGAAGLTTLNNTSIYPLFALRLNSNYFHSAIKLLSFSINCTSTAAYNYYLILNPTVTGTALSFTAITNSSLEADVGTTNATTISGGTVLLAGASQQNTDGGVTGILDTDFYLGSTIDGVSDRVCVGVQRVSGTTETFFGAINWRDQQ